MGCAAFAASPAPYADKFSDVVGQGGRYDDRGAGLVVKLRERAILQALLDGGSDAERVAIHRAVAIGAMDRVDDDRDDLGQLFREHERSYLELIRRSARNRGGL